MSGPYANAAPTYYSAGWRCILPVPSTTKYPPPVGYTGEAGADTPPAVMFEWATSMPHHSIALRLPDGVVGLDVDHYDKTKTVQDPSTGEAVTKVVHKRGGDVLAELEVRLGQLPPTWTSTARSLPSGIRFYRVPGGRYRTSIGDAIEVIQHHHRYAVVAPSPHSEAGGFYGWLRPDGSPALEGQVPVLAELAELPEPWVDFLREGATAAGPVAADHGSGAALAAELAADDRDPCADVARAVAAGLAQLRAAEAGSRHDVAITRVHLLVMLGASGHPGVGSALAELAAVWEELTAGEARGEEFQRMVLTSARKAVTAHGARAAAVDPCLLGSAIVASGMAAAGVTAAEHPAAGGGHTLAELAGQLHTEESEVGLELEPAAFWHPRMVTGAAPFDPPYDQDQLLGQAVLGRMWPVLRFAADAQTWLLRGPEAWEARGGELAAWAIAEVAELMPSGVSDAEKGTPEQRQAARRARLLSQAGASAIAGKMRAAVSGVGHPSTLKLADLDTEPWVLWAGGSAWDLRRSVDGPEPAHLDPGTPHLHTAACAPEVMPTPLWDRLLKSVWPEDDVRAWALRVLSISLVGYADAALPILLGETGRGKSAVVVRIMDALGSYAHTADTRILGSGEPHASVFYALKGRRLSFVDEGLRRSAASLERIKQLTGGTPITANQMHRDPVTFRPTHTLVLTANPEAAPDITDPALRRRVRLIPCDGDPAEVRDAWRALGQLDERRWLRERPGVLAQLMIEAARWLADRDSGTTEVAPLSVQAKTMDTLADQDLVGLWLAEQTEPWEEGTLATGLFASYVEWARARGLRDVGSMTRFGLRLSRQTPPIPRRHTREGKRWGLRVRVPGFGPFTPPPPPPAAAVLAPPAVTTGGVNPSPQAVTTRHTDPSPAENVPTVQDRSRDGWVGDGSTRHEGQPVTQPVTPPDLGEQTPCDGLTGFFLYPANIEKEGKYIGEKENPNPTRHPVTAPSGEPGGQPGLFDLEPAAEPAAPARRRAPARRKRTPEEVAAERRRRAEEKADAKAQARAAALAELAGPSRLLPALVELGEGDTPAEVRVRTLTASTDVLEALEPVLAEGRLDVDVETTGYPLGHRLYALRTVQLGGTDRVVVLDPSYVIQAELIRTLLRRAARLGAFSATADLAPLAAAGLVDYDDAWRRMDDVMIRAKLTDPQGSGRAAGLKDTAAKHLNPAVSPAADAARKALFAKAGWLTDLEVDTPIERSGWAQIDSGCLTMLRYSASDVFDTAALPSVLPEVSPEVLEREHRAAAICARVGLHGLRLDPDQVLRLRAEHATERDRWAARVRELAPGVDNPASSQQLARHLEDNLKVTLPRTKPTTRYPEGQPTVEESVLKPYVKEGPPELAEFAHAVLEYRTHATAYNGPLRWFDAMVTQGDGRIRPTIYTLEAQTGRMSAARPNVQQINKKGGQRACVLADEGNLLITADFSSVEVRVMAALSQDQELIRQLRDGMDLHALIAELVFGPQWTKENRYACKGAVFGKSYGAGLEKVASTVGVDLATAGRIIDALNEVAPGFVQWSRDVQAAVRAGSTQYTAYSGRVIHLDKGYPHKAVNYLVQGTARELLVDALIRWDESPFGGGIVVPVHDEIIAQVPKHQAKDALAELVRCMETNLYGVDIKAEPSTPSPFWRDAT